MALPVGDPMRMINRLAAVFGWLLLAAIVFATFSPINLRPGTGHVVLERVLTFVALGAAFGVGYPRRLLMAVGITTLAAVGLEAGQLLVPGRHARLIDAGEKLTGGLIGLALAALFLVATTRLRTPAESGV